MIPRRSFRFRDDVSTLFLKHANSAGRREGERILWAKFGTRRIHPRSSLAEKGLRSRARMRIVFSAIEGPRRAPKPEIMAVTREIGSSIFGDGNPDVIRRR